MTVGTDSDMSAAPDTPARARGRWFGSHVRRPMTRPTFRTQDGCDSCALQGLRARYQSSYHHGWWRATLSEVPRTTSYRQSRSQALVLAAVLYCSNALILLTFFQVAITPTVVGIKNRASGRRGLLLAAAGPSRAGVEQGVEPWSFPSCRLLTPPGSPGCRTSTFENCGTRARVRASSECWAAFFTTAKTSFSG